MIKHDRSDVSIVTTCTECPWWFAFNFDRDKADASGTNHKINVHGFPESRALDTVRARARRARHAVSA